jgi:hypothetical protein
MIVWHEISMEVAACVWDSGIWEGWSDKEKVMLQLFTDRMCMPMNVFHDALESELNHSVHPRILATFLDMLRDEWMAKYDLSLVEVHAACVVMCEEAARG